MHAVSNAPCGSHPLLWPVALGGLPGVMEAGTVAGRGRALVPGAASASSIQHPSKLNLPS